MKSLAVLVGLFLTVLAVLDEREQWLNFKSKHGKIYNNPQEEIRRFSIFQQNLKAIKEHNLLYEAGEATYEMDINQFADLSAEEFQAILTRQSITRPQSRTGSMLQKPLEGEIPESTDWREVGAVSDVKDQGTCGGCWAFSAIATLESFYYLKHGNMVTFSEQQLLDCDLSQNGCHGGEEAPALDYIKSDGIMREDDYPYEEKQGSCRYNYVRSNTTITDYVQIARGDEDTLLSVVGLKGPVSVALDARGLVFYRKGVYTNANCSQAATNHAVLAAGYGYDEETGLDYWLIKNSWGISFGEQGYFKIRRGVNECAIAIDNVYPVL